MPGPTSDRQRVAHFRDLHRPGQPLLLANAWDPGSAKVFVSLGFSALATTSSGFAATLGQFDGTVTRDEALTHAGTIASAVDVPVSADLENGFAGDSTGVAETVRLAIEAGLAGCSIEDSTGNRDEPIYGFETAVERVTAAADAAAHEPGLVLTARAENHLHGRTDLADTIRRLQAFQTAGADVVYAPGLVTIEDIRAVVTSVDLPVNVLALPAAPNVAELAAAGVARISVGGAFAYVALAAAADAGRELLDAGTYDYWEQAASGRRRARDAF
jgi:2-methylisocitrate lyase-like PEP mutase family enzyme